MSGLYRSAVLGFMAHGVGLCCMILHEAVDWRAMHYPRCSDTPSSLHCSIGDTPSSISGGIWSLTRSTGMFVRSTSTARDYILPVSSAPQFAHIRLALASSPATNFLGIASSPTTEVSRTHAASLAEWSDGSPLAS